MKNFNLFLTALFVCSIFMFSCSSTQKEKVSSMEATEEGDEVAQEEIISTTKKITKSDIKSTTYAYILEGKTVATEIVDTKGEVIFFQGEIPNGLIKEYDADNNIVSEMNYNAGKLEGVTKTFYPGGKTVSSVKNYRSGILEGKVIEYYENGNKKLDSNYKDGIFNGNVKKYSMSGTLISSAQYSDGQLEGMYKEYFVTGTPKIETEYYNGLKEGLSKEYFSGGILKSQYNYSQGKLEGDSHIYYEDGSINRIEKYKNNKLNGDTKIYSNNNSEIPLYIDTYVNGKKKVRKAFSSKGEQIFKIQY